MNYKYVFGKKIEYSHWNGLGMLQNLWHQTMIHSLEGLQTSKLTLVTELIVILRSSYGCIFIQILETYLVYPNELRFMLSLNNLGNIINQCA